MYGLEMGPGAAEAGGALRWEHVGVIFPRLPGFQQDRAILRFRCQDTHAMACVV